MRFAHSLILTVCFLFSATNLAHAQTDILKDAYAKYNTHMNDAKTYFALAKTQKGNEYCLTFQKLKDSYKLVASDLDTIIKNSKDPQEIDAKKKEAEKIAGFRVKLDEKYNNECSALAVQKHDKIAKRNEYIETYNRNIEDAAKARQEALQYIRYNSSPSYICSAFRSERESLNYAHSALYSTFGLVPELDYKGESIIPTLKAKFEQNKVDIDYGRC